MAACSTPAPVPVEPIPSLSLTLPRLPEPEREVQLVVTPYHSGETCELGLDYRSTLPAPTGGTSNVVEWVRKRATVTASDAAGIASLAATFPEVASSVNGVAMSSPLLGKSFQITRVAQGFAVLADGAKPTPDVLDELTLDWPHPEDPYEAILAARPWRLEEEISARAYGEASAPLDLETLSVRSMSLTLTRLDANVAVLAMSGLAELPLQHEVLAFGYRGSFEVERATGRIRRTEVHALTVGTDARTGSPLKSNVDYVATKICKPG